MSMKRITHSLKMACRYPYEVKKAKKSDEPYNLTTLQNVVYTSPPPSSPVLSPATPPFPKVPLPQNEITNEFNPLQLPPTHTSFIGSVHDSKVKTIIEALRILPITDLNTLTLVNVLDQYYNGIGGHDDGTWISVTFRENIDPSFRDIFLDCTKSSK